MVVPKGERDVRECVDICRANEAIVRERPSISTMKKLLHDFNGVTVFSKIDLNGGFYQILLSEDSGHITILATHQDLYLMLGVTSAPEKCQQIVEDGLSSYWSWKIADGSN